MSELIKCDECEAIIGAVYFHIDITKKIVNQNFAMVEYDLEVDLCPICFGKLEANNKFLH